MIGRALDNRESIDSFVSRNKDFRSHELSEEDWASIEMVTAWLRSFSSATIQMSATRVPMLSTTHAIFRGLQSDLCDVLRSLPDTASPKRKRGLTDAHLKLSDYYHTFDESPFYLWSAHMFCVILLCPNAYNTCYLVLDPRISYSALKDEFENDAELSTHLEITKDDLREYYKAKYEVQMAPSSTPMSSASQPEPRLSQASMSALHGSPQKNFIARFQRKPRAATDELQEFWSLPQEDFETCDPLHWWYGRRVQFPNLYWLARDIFSIPGKYHVPSSSGSS